MAASLRTPESVLELSGLDRITMPPNIIEALEKLNINSEKKLDKGSAQSLDIKKIDMNEKIFRYMLNDDEVGNLKLAEGIRLFAADAIKLEKIIKEKLAKL